MLIQKLKADCEWEEFLKNCPESTFFHSLKWKEVIQKSFSYSAHYVTIRDSCGSLVGVYPGFIRNNTYMRFFDSLPHSDYGGPIITELGLEKASVSLINYLHNLSSDKDLAYTRCCLTAYDLDQNFDSSSAFIEQDTGVVEIDLKATSSGLIWKNLFSNHRRYLFRRIERHGFQAREAESISDLKEFYNLYYRNMKFIDASPRRFSFVENMWRILYPANLRIWLLEKTDPIGGILVFKYNQSTYCYYAGIDRRKSKNIPVVAYLVWKEIEAAENEGYKCVSLGSTPSNPRSQYFSKKVSMGGKFRQQKTVWYPLSPSGMVFLCTFPILKTIKNTLPVAMQNRLMNLVRF
jgi:hypothetical protein